jgi:YD repeat-containing protein
LVAGHSGERNDVTLERRKPAAALAGALLLLVVSGCGAAGVPTLHLKPDETVGPVPARDPLRQAVEVAHLEPETEIGVDVISGMPYEAAEDRGLGGGRPSEHEALIGLVDPQAHNQIFSYRSGGIPGEPAWNPRWGAAVPPAPGTLPQWIPPRLVSRSGRPVAIVLADERRLDLETDARGRVVQVHWATPHGEPLLTSISYAPGRTTVSAPAGVVRTYRYDSHDRITEVDAPGAAASARHDTADGYLDSKATARMLGYRLRSGTAERYAAYGAAPRAIAENSFESPAVGAHQTYGVRSLAWMRVVDRALRGAGVLDVAEAIPVYSGYVETYSQEKQFEKVTSDLIGGCDISVGYYRLTYGLDTSLAKIATIASRLERGPDHWTEIEFADRHSLGCAEPV